MIKILVLKTCHSILGDVNSGSEHIHYVRKPVLVVSQPSSDGMNTGFAPFLEYSDEWTTGVPIKDDDVLCVITPTKDLYNHYNKFFGSGIEIVSSLN